jgi:nucleoside-diphosphate-sugar epimerase
MKYLVTGADGFLGRHFLQKLAERDTPVRAMLIGDPPAEGLPGQPEYVTADITRPETLGKAVEGVTHVIHLAARVHMMNDTAEDPEAEFHRVNVEGTMNLLQAANAAGAKRFLLMSSVKAMGEEAPGVFDETSPCEPETPYGRSKLAAEQAIFQFSTDHAIETTALRLPMVYGPGNKGNMLRLLEAAQRGKKLPLGRVQNRRSMVYVGNVVDAALTAAEHPDSAGEVFLVCDSRPYSSRELYDAIGQAMGKDNLLRNVPIWLLRLAGCIGSCLEAVTRKTMPVNRDVVIRLTSDLVFDASKLRNRLSFESTVELRDGIARTVEWFDAGCPPVPNVES